MGLLGELGDYGIEDGSSHVVALLSAVYGLGNEALHSRTQTADYAGYAAAHGAAYYVTSYRAGYRAHRAAYRAAYRAAHYDTRGYAHGLGDRAPVGTDVKVLAVGRALKPPVTPPIAPPTTPTAVRAIRIGTLY